MIQSIFFEDRLRVDFCEESGYWGFTLHLKKEDRQFFCKSEDDRKVWVKAIKTSVPFIRNVGKNFAISIHGSFKILSK